MGNVESRRMPDDDASSGSVSFDQSINNASTYAATYISERGQTMVDNLMRGNLCGSLGTVEERDDVTEKSRQDLLSKAQNLCYSRPDSPADGSRPLSGRRRQFLGPDEDSDSEDGPVGTPVGSPEPKCGTDGDTVSALFARALVSEVTDNPKTMTPAAMAEREKKLMKAQEKANRAKSEGVTAVGAPGGIKGPPGVLGALQNLSLRGEQADVGDDAQLAEGPRRVEPPNRLIENRAQVKTTGDAEVRRGKHTITIGLSLSRRHSTLGHPDTVTRQTAFDFNELQDRQYKFVSSTDSSGWRAGGGERGGVVPHPSPLPDVSLSMSEEGAESSVAPLNNGLPGASSFSNNKASAQAHKIAAPDTVHIPIINIDCESKEAVDKVISSLASGELFIPHMSILPEALSVNGISPPDLVVRFGCERNEDLPPDEWPNWCLEFMHNQLYEYFLPLGARWEERPFQITLARKVRWKTVKHMNKFFAHSERVINAWRENGPQYLDPQLSYLEDGATPEEVARPHGIYLLRNGKPTNYFAPNFEPPYTTKMTRSLLLNVINKSWDKKRRDWSSEAIPRLVTPGMLLTTMCGCTDGNQGGFVATEATNRLSPISQPYKPRATDQIGDYSELREENVPQHRKAQDKSLSVSEIPTEDKSTTETSRDFPGDNVSSQVPSPGSNGTKRFFPSPEPSGLAPGWTSPALPRSDSPIKQPLEPEELLEIDEDQVVDDTEATRDSQRSKRSSSQGYGAKDGEKGLHLSKAPSAAAGNSIGESQTTVPIRNGLLEVERERRKEREKERELERKKMEALERTLQEHMKEKEMNQKKMAELERRLQQQKEKENERAEKERAEKERAEKERAEKERAEKERAEKERAEKERAEKERAQKRRAEREQGRLEKEKMMEEKKVSDARSEAKVRKLKEQKRQREKARDKQIKLIALAAEETEKAKAVVSKLQTQPLSPRAAAELERERRSKATRRSQSPSTRQTAATSKMEQPKEPRSTTRRSQSPSTRNTAAALMKVEQPKERRSTNSRSKSPSIRKNAKVNELKARRSTKTRRSQSPSTRQRTYDMTSSSPSEYSKRQQQLDVKSSASAETLEYSIDSSMLGSASGNNTPRGSIAAKSTSSHRGEDSSSAAASMMAADIIPSDEELFMVGWAKALDPNSGSYYYFTLDRSETVWENPLLTIENTEDFAAPASNASSSASSGAYANNGY